MPRVGGRYWLGEWICADCGYIYGSRGEQQPFETLGRSVSPFPPPALGRLRAVSPPRTIAKSSRSSTPPS